VRLNNYDSIQSKLRAKQNFLDRFDRLKRQYSILNDENSLRIYSNNSRYNSTLEAYTHYAMNHHWISSPENYRLHHKEVLLEHYAERGDPLCKAIVKFLKEMKGLERDRILESLSIPERILQRKLTKVEYEGLLNGVISLTSNSERIYLPKPKNTSLK